MTTRRYQRPTFRLVLDFDPVTWDALKERAPGAMERTAYKLIQDGLGLIVATATDAAPAEPPSDAFRSPAFPPLRPRTETEVLAD